MRSEANRKNIPSSAEQINRESRGGSVSRWRNYFLVNAKEEKKMQKRKVKMGRVIDGTRSTQYATVSRIYSPLFSVLLDPGNHIGMAGNVRGRARQRIAETSLGGLLLDYALYRVL